mmetsp:Transcript_43450/g.137395  ORF Transcript_43450/g.137395 Transcript_43450/m.137395 type:complete len:234 (-) Transcript_43450:1496-2197(-)
MAQARLDAARARGNPVEIAGAEQGLTQAQDRSQILRASISPLFAFEGLRALAKKSMKDSAITNLKEFLRNRLSAEQHLESGNRTPTEVFSSLNPIDRVVSMSKTKDEGPYTCLLEACSGSGKSMCAVDYFVRNPDTCLYFLFGHKHTQLIYQEVSEITNLINRALDIDLWNCIGEYTSNQGEAAALVAINISMKRSQGWHVLGVLGFLLNQTEEVNLSLSNKRRAGSGICGFY